MTALVAASGAGLAGCGAYVSTNTGAADTGTATGSDTNASESYEVACRRGIVNDPYPGVCHDYVDTDSNGICDLSELVQTDSAQVSTLATTDDDQEGSGLEGCPLAPCVVCGICANLG